MTKTMKMYALELLEEKHLELMDSLNMLNAVFPDGAVDEDKELLINKKVNIKYAIDVLEATEKLHLAGSYMTFNKLQEEESVYINERYKSSLERLNTEITKQQEMRTKFPPHSKEYRECLAKEIELEKDKMIALKTESEALDAQINNVK